jgi:sterol desaturase/sphingolipid hydroxylase (fatty acid hydroxylase superfamily)
MPLCKIIANVCVPEPDLGVATCAVVMGSFCVYIGLFSLTAPLFTKLQPARRVEQKEWDLCVRMAGTNVAWLVPMMLASGRALSMLLAPWDSELPAPLAVFGRMVLCLVVDDAWFFGYHRMLHQIPFLYKHIHKPHHVFTAPFPLVALAQHPVEMLLQSVGGQLGALVLLHAHPLEFWLYLAVRIYFGVEDHVGVAVPWSLSRLLPGVFGGSEFHDEHHVKFTGNYASVLPLLDRLFGTAL